MRDNDKRIFLFGCTKKQISDTELSSKTLMDVSFYWKASKIR